MASEVIEILTPYDPLLCVRQAGVDNQLDIDLLVHESGTLDSAAFARKYGVARGYLTESNDWFEKVAHIEPRWNRAIFYDGTLFHCSDIPAPERLSEDPARGRLTLNGFFHCTRRAE